MTTRWPMPCAARGARAVRPAAGALLAVALAAGALEGQRQVPWSVPDSLPSVVTRGRVDPRREVNFSALAVPASVYVGQQVTYQIGVFLSEDVAQRLRRNPEFVPPDVRSMLAYDLASPARPLPRLEAGRRYDVHVFQRALFPLTAGAHELAPARLTYALPLSNSFFSREETHAARTSAITVVAREPPAAGRPVDYSGAVGRLAVSARVDSSPARVGDPVTFVVRVEGIGNVSLFPRPVVSLPWGDAVAGAERVAIDSGVPLVQGRKDFEWVLTPRQEGSLTVPAVRYPFWNPYTERYEVALTQPLVLRVGGGTLAARVPTAADSTPRLALRTRYRGALPPVRATSPVLWALLGVAPLPALALALRHRPRRVRGEAFDATLRRLAGDGRSAPSAIRRAFAGAVARRTGIGAATMTDGRALARALRHAGVSTSTAHRAQLLLAELDRATYGGEAPGHEVPAALARQAAEVFSAVDLEAIPVLERPSRGWPSGRAMVVATVLIGGAAVAGADTDEAARFARGVTLFDKGEYRPSMLAFRGIVEQVPRAADAWANLGTAAWYADDSAAAAVGWQRALRLEPTARDVRTRLEATPGFRAGLLGDVPPIPVDAAAALGALLWLAGWATMAYAWGRPQADLRRPALLIVCGASVVGILAVALHERHAGRDRVVVTVPDRLRIAPALGAEVGADVVRGEAARVLGAQGVWSRVRLGDGRTGWIASSHVVSLQAPLRASGDR